MRLYSTQCNLELRLKYRPHSFLFETLDKLNRSEYSHNGMIRTLEKGALPIAMASLALVGIGYNHLRDSSDTKLPLSTSPGQTCESPEFPTSREEVRIRRIAPDAPMQVTSPGEGFLMHDGDWDTIVYLANGRYSGDEDGQLWSGGVAFADGETKQISAWSTIADSDRFITSPAANENNAEFIIGFRIDEDEWTQQDYEGATIVLFRETGCIGEDAIAQRHIDVSVVQPLANSVFAS